MSTYLLSWYVHVVHLTCSVTTTKKTEIRPNCKAPPCTRKFQREYTWLSTKLNFSWCCVCHNLRSSDGKLESKFRKNKQNVVSWLQTFGKLDLYGQRVGGMSGICFTSCLKRAIIRFIDTVNLQNMSERWPSLISPFWWKLRNIEGAISSAKGTCAGSFPAVSFSHLWLINGNNTGQAFIVN